MRIAAPFFALSLVYSATACDAGPTPDGPVSSETACGDLICPTGKADGAQSDLQLNQSEPVQWLWADFIGRGLEREALVEGHVEVYFFGPELPLATGSIFDDGTDEAFLQPVFLRFDAPSSFDPNVIVERSYYGLLQSWDGQTYSLATSYGMQSSLIDAEHPQLASLFNAAYDFDTQEGRVTVRTGEETLYGLRLERNEDGKVQLADVTFGRTETINSARHTFNVHFRG